MPARSWTIRRQDSARSWSDLVRQVLLFALAYLGYRFVRGLVEGRINAAFAHARAIIDFERSMHIFVEPAVQGWTTSRHWLIDLASWMYVNTHFTITLVVLVFIYFLRNRSFYFVRNMLLVAMAIALIGYVIYPTAPPRLMPEWGFTDSVANLTGASPDSSTVSALFNPFAAVPSMHVAFALLLGWSMSRLVRLRALKLLWALYPVFVTWVVVATANHYWTDAALGALTAALSALIAQRLARVRPDAWAFRPELDSPSAGGGRTIGQLA